MDEIVNVMDMTDRAIIEETLLHLRAISDLIQGFGPMIQSMESNPMVKMLMRSAGG